MIMLFVEAESTGRTIAFSKTASATSLMDECPSSASGEQLKELHIKLR